MSDVPRTEPGDGPEDDLDIELIDDDPPETDDQEPGDDGGETPPDDVADSPDNQQQRERPKRRGEAHRWRERAEQADRNVADLRREIAELRTQRQSAPDAAAQARAEAEEMERLSQMSLPEAIKFVRDSERRLVGQALAQTRLQTQDAIDRREFAAAARTDPLYRQYADRVNAHVENMLRNGQFVERETVLKALVGDDVLTRRQRNLPREQRRGAAAVVRQTVRPASGRGDVARGGGRTRDQAADDLALLRGVTVVDL